MRTQALERGALDGNPPMPRWPFIAVGLAIEAVLHLAEFVAYHTRPRR